MIIIPASETVNLVISHSSTSNTFKSEPKVKMGVIGLGVFFIVRVPRILKKEILDLTKKVDIIYESGEFIESFVDFDYRKKNRQKVVDKIKTGTASRGAYTPRFADLSCWKPSDSKNRKKKLAELKKKNRQRTIAEIKITGFPIFQLEEFDIFDTIVE